MRGSQVRTSNVKSRMLWEFWPETFFLKLLSMNHIGLRLFPNSHCIRNTIKSMRFPMMLLFGSSYLNLYYYFSNVLKQNSH